MKQLRNFFVYSPGGENESGNIGRNNMDDKKNDLNKSSLIEEENNEKKPLMEKIHDALQEWSNEDQREQDFDDTRP